ncbi:carboxypeptidase regulatory-like domain-containing protein [Pseudomonas sp. BGI-2]|uniref:carboxypeptidase regulatory-like domain-containing protein n=1 Tax=Pseudomonas sp. BGI-2 TaxID=2528211 RepID=UPI0010336BCB|nr:carboxypeptidase regulatory-like domain-containing protein [Pseudomonas sp. BGI-2]TBN33753.1 carboxypeptidase regulatory-like domain-containing protein [Pseudomonas sp. BGI-2]
MNHMLSFLLFIALAGCGSSPRDGVAKPGDGVSALAIAQVDGALSSGLSASQSSTPDAPLIATPVDHSLSGLYPLLSGTGIPGATVQIVQTHYANRVLVRTTVDANGRWAARSALELAPGPYSIGGRQTLDGKTSDWGLNRAFTVVETPDAPVIENPPKGSESGRYPLLSGKGIPGATVQVVKTHYANITLVRTTADARGHWEAHSALELPFGAYSIGARQTLNAKTSVWGDNVAFTVVASTGSSIFKVLEAPTGELNADTLGAEASVQVSYPRMGLGDTVGIRLTGVALRDAPIQTVRAAGILTFYLPKAWIAENLNRTVTLTYTYKAGGVGSLITSAPLSIKVVGSTVPNDGVRVASELNAQYSNTSNTCPGNKAAYECSGVLIRTVDDSPAFRAWNPSPYAVKSGGVSFSYMKVGIGMNRLQGSRTQGFVLEPGQFFTANGGYPLQVLCSFPYDGNTLNRSAAGCGASADFPGNSGPCSAQGINTLAAWRAHFQQHPASSTNRYTHQCGFAPDQASFALSLIARENPAGELTAWQQNEVVIKIWPQDTSNLPIKAFIYFSSASRAVGVEGAKNIQRDFLKMTGRRVPVIRVTPNATTGGVFSYFAADQGI